MSSDGPVDLEDLVITAYCALDDALKHAGITNNKGKLIPRRGPPPEVDDREMLCLCLLQEWLGFDSDLSFYGWFESNQVMCGFFPIRLSRQNRADRRTLLTPLLERLSAAFAEMAGDDDEEEPLFIIDSHPVDVCRPIRERKNVRLDGMAKKGYRASLKRWFVGLREHLVFTPDGRIAFMLQLEGNRHDVQGYTLFLRLPFAAAFWRTTAIGRSRTSGPNLKNTA